MRPALILGSGIVIGAVVLGVARLLALPPAHATHYHANFAVFVNGQRLDLTDTRFMEDISKCKADPMQQDPVDRVHLHSGDHDVVHVHAPATSWANLFTNLQMALGNEWVVLPSGEALRLMEGKSLHFVLNGVPVDGIANRAIRSRDRLLVSYGAEKADALVATQFAAVKDNAGEFNEKPDPSTCSGPHAPTLGERLRQAFWF